MATLITYKADISPSTVLMTATATSTRAAATAASLVAPRMPRVFRFGREVPPVHSLRVWHSRGQSNPMLSRRLTTPSLGKYFPENLPLTRPNGFFSAPALTVTGSLSARMTSMSCILMVTVISARASTMLYRLPDLNRILPRFRSYLAFGSSQDT